MRKNNNDIELVPACQGDASALADLRVLAMRESLERIGRFDPIRARTRFLLSFSSENTRHIDVAGQRVGFVVFVTESDPLLLDHLYIQPKDQNAGIGGAVLGCLFAEAGRLGSRIRVGALRESASNRFYLNHGFALVEETKWDNYYIWTGN